MPSFLVSFVSNYLIKFPLVELDVNFLRRALLHLFFRHWMIDLVNEGRIEPKAFGVDFLKAVAFHPTWETDPWLQAFKASDHDWIRQVSPDEQLTRQILDWLSDVRRFEASEVGFDWLMILVKRGERHYHDFAKEYMIKAFIPADFAPGGAEEESKEPSGEINIDLEAASILFTGKLKTMTRGEAQKKVVAANGKKASGVSAKLDYLVIGDEGSPLYDQGRKGSKQVKAESLIEGGAPIKIISETAFLRMLEGKQVSASADQTEAGCEQLWQMAHDDKDPALQSFAVNYLQRHHPDISMELTDRPTDPGSEILNEFLSFERVKPLLLDKRPALRNLALMYARWELARWKPDATELRQLVENSEEEVQTFIQKAILAEDLPEHRRYRIDPNIFDAAAVYPFLESKSAHARALGMRLIDRDSELAKPEALFQLTESTDRNLLSFVVSMLWRLYRDRGITYQWKPESYDKSRADQKGGAPERPEQAPAAHESLHQFLRRILLRIPPPRFGKDDCAQPGYQSARKVKLRLIEVIRDMALGDVAFATMVAPLFQEMLASHGSSEKGACLVALVRIGDRFPELNSLSEEVSA